MLEMLDLYRAIIENGQTRTPMREGALTLDLALAMAQSAQIKAPVTLSA
jgi:hypothetical protein